MCPFSKIAAANGIGMLAARFKQEPLSFALTSTVPRAAKLRAHKCVTRNCHAHKAHYRAPVARPYPCQAQLTNMASGIGTGYDLSANTYSPDGKIFQTEYAQKAIDNGR
jgi:hypothetical protein